MVNLVVVGVEEACVATGAAGARAAVQEERRPAAVPLPVDLEVEGVEVADAQRIRAQRRTRCVERPRRSSLCWHQSFFFFLFKNQ